MLKEMMKRVIYKLVQLGKLDMRSVNKRISAFGSRQFELSAVYAPNNTCSKPTERLYRIFADLVIASSRQSLELYKQRKNVPDYVYMYPGEHYRALPALVQVLNASKIVEIGTYTGLSSIAFFHALNTERHLTTFDLFPWDTFFTTALESEDFIKYNFKQVLADLGNVNNVIAHKEALQQADLIFCDAPKDGMFEKKLLMNFQHIKLKEGCILFFDDIRQWNMLKIWYDIQMPKLDITPVGHFTGAGLIEWDNSIKCFE